MYKTYKGDLFCPRCGHAMSLQVNISHREADSGEIYEVRDYCITCPQGGCPLMGKRQELPEVVGAKKLGV